MSIWTDDNEILLIQARADRDEARQALHDARHEIERLRAEVEIWRGRTLGIIKAWETLPGPKNYTGGDIQRWLAGHMKRAIDAARPSKE
jgi:hypothetical protein